MDENENMDLIHFLEQKVKKKKKVCLSADIPAPLCDPSLGLTLQPQVFWDCNIDKNIGMWWHSLGLQIMEGQASKKSPRAGVRNLCSQKPFL